MLDVYEAAKDAVHHARSGAGPVFMEFFTYRMRGHVGPDDNVQGVHTDIRPAEEVEVWAKNDPILKFEDYLRNHYPSVDDNLNVIRNEVSAEVKEAVEKAVNSEFPDAKEVEEYVFRKKN